MIISGIRTAAVMIIGTATLAALIGAGGLGSFILLGIDRNNSSLILIGALSSAALALLFNYGIQRLQQIRLQRMWLNTCRPAAGIDGILCATIWRQAAEGNAHCRGQTGTGTRTPHSDVQAC